MMRLAPILLIITLAVCAAYRAAELLPAGQIDIISCPAPEASEPPEHRRPIVGDSHSRPVYKAGDAVNKEMISGGFSWPIDPYVRVNESGNSVKMGNRCLDWFMDEKSQQFSAETRERREALVQRLNLWCKPYDLRAYGKLLAHVDPQLIVEELRRTVKNPIFPFLSPDTWNSDTRFEFMERVGDDLSFAERTLDVSPGRFRNRFIDYLEQKIDGTFDRRYKHLLEPPKSEKPVGASHVYDQTAEKLRPLSLAERREYLAALRERLIETFKYSSVSDFYKFFLRRFLVAMADRGIIFDEDRNIDPDVFFNDNQSIE